MSSLIDISAALDALCRDLCRTLPELAHIEPGRVLFALSRSRAPGKHGLYARINPLRFAGGSRQQARRRAGYREVWQLPVLQHEGRSILYLITVLFPRFLRLCPEQKLLTVVHELFHISERCDGDIRRFAGRNFAHGASRHEFDQRVAGLGRRYLETRPPEETVRVLDLREEDWLNGSLRVTGIQTAMPKAVLISRQRC